MDAPYRQGIPYVSRDEAQRAVDNAAKRGDRGQVRETLGVKESEHDSLRFLQLVRRLLDDWLALDRTNTKVCFSISWPWQILAILKIRN